MTAFDTEPRESLTGILRHYRDAAKALETLHREGRAHGSIHAGAIRRMETEGLRPPAEGGSAPVEFRDPEAQRMLIGRGRLSREALARQDVFALGASLFAELEGGPPLCGPEPVFTRGVPPSVAYVVHRAMAEGAARYPTAGIMAKDLDAVLDGTEEGDLVAVAPQALPSYQLPKAPPPSPPSPLRPFSPRLGRRRGIRVSRVLVLASLVVLAAVYLPRGNAAPSKGAPAKARVSVANGPPALPALLAGFRSRLDRVLEAGSGRKLDPDEVPLLLVADVPVSRDLGWPLDPSPSLERRVRASLHDGVTAEAVQSVLLKSVGGDTLPAVLWVTAGSVPGTVRARLYYAGLRYEGSAEPATP